VVVVVVPCIASCVDLVISVALRLKWLYADEITHYNGCMNLQCLFLYPNLCFLFEYTMCCSQHGIHNCIFFHI
jgi:hypothetical protein